MEEYKGLTPDEQILDEMLSRMVDDGIISMTWNEVDGLVYYMTDEQKLGIKVRYQEG